MVEGLEEDEMDPAPNARCQDRRAANMCDRPRDWIHITLSESHEFEQGVGRGHDAGVRMSGTLGVGGGAGRVIDRARSVSRRRWRWGPRRAARVRGWEIEPGWGIHECSDHADLSPAPRSHRRWKGCATWPGVKILAHSSGTMRSSVATCWVMNDTFSLAQDRNQWVLDGTVLPSVTRSTTASIVVGQPPRDDGVVVILRRGAAAVASASSGAGLVVKTDRGRSTTGVVRLFLGRLSDELPECQWQRRSRHPAPLPPRATTSLAS